ncbi:hypothetical protein CB0940_08955 [Cercospora beticola]|uniref:Cyanovirin-N domain-containing protein n=1 Tax=Cercospora beticola TaxID=122368 RepID=A0A2G5HPF0_CERBT|nr:hypothetical protein CB0940_08955 [Cercospora beticola]PIA94426.1 hypothetical protein CB0940_08955 [Cercospora beticola]WPB05553.1 hypothetical protein RHO25_010206 [Cercospora beticola]CAK1365377.1 unnamed protein product [Cercospora beticola]
MGSLSQTCKEVTIQLEDGSRPFQFQCHLNAQCMKLDGTWKSSTFDLNILLDNYGGKFAVGKKENGFSRTAYNIRLETTPTAKDAQGKEIPGKMLLKASLNNGWGNTLEDEIDLEVLLANMNGVLTTRFNYEALMRQEGDCAEFLENVRNIRLGEQAKLGPVNIFQPQTPADQQHELIAEVKNEDGSWVERRVELDDYLGNRNGYIVRNDKNFSKTCGNMQLSYWDSKKQRVNKDGQPLVLKRTQNLPPGIVTPAEHDLIDIDPRDWVIKPTNWSGPDYNGPWDPPSQPYPPSLPTTVCLECDARTRSQPSSRHNKILLSAIIMPTKGQFAEATLPIIIGVPEKHTEMAATELQKTLDENPGARVEWADDPNKEGLTKFYVFLGVKEHGGEGIFFQTTTMEARASIQHYVQDKHVSRFQHVAYDVFTAEIHGVKAPFYAGVGASIDLIQAEASIFDLTLGLGVESGIGVLDETAEIEFLGCGILIGRKVGISVFGNVFDVNLGRLFGF